MSALPACPALFQIPRSDVAWGVVRGPCTGTVLAPLWSSQKRTERWLQPIRRSSTIVYRRRRKKQSMQQQQQRPNQERKSHQPTRQGPTSSSARSSTPRWMKRRRTEAGSTSYHTHVRPWMTWNELASPPTSPNSTPAWKGDLAGDEASAAAVGHACVHVQDDLECARPTRRSRTGRLMLAGTATAAMPVASLWTTPPDTTSVVWELQELLVPLRDDELELLHQWRVRPAPGEGTLSYSIAGVLESRPDGTVRVGLASTSTSPAAAGRVSAAHRLPFFYRTLDIVQFNAIELDGGRSMAPRGGVMLEFAPSSMLRPGGLFWLDHFSCAGEELNATFAPMIGRVGFKKLRWNTGRVKGKNHAAALGTRTSARGIFSTPSYPEKAGSPCPDSPSVDEPCGGNLGFSGHWILTNVFVTQADILASASSTPAFAFASL
ncbi:hypothetical protein HU200_028439 [Digitaria exilis]|uniref:Uncharacterized protein n=1 Tax=Digitaria exilis TaxID=1010633 RepID=A0A835ESI7_9POAL|nr:hypothetical protein HU200_028439 [Digitaria exilis]